MARNRNRNTDEARTADHDHEPVNSLGGELLGDEADTQGTVSLDDTPAAEAPAPEPVPEPVGKDKPEAAHVPLSAGQGGRYTMINGRRVLRDD